MPPRRPGQTSAGSSRVWLAGVAVLFFAVQVVLIRDLPLGWDESIYASQTDPRRPAMVFSAPRARGTSLIAAPLQLLTGSTVALRVFLAALSSVALYGAYAVWLRIRGNASVPIAALGLTSLWVTVFYGPTTMPNVWVALAGVYATGTLLCAASGRHPRWLPWAGGVAIAAATAMRPGDMAPLVMALAAAVVFHRPWRVGAVRLLSPALLGAAVGALPWLVEAQLRYDGIVARLRRAAQAQGTGERLVPDYQLRALDGPILCRPCQRESQPIPPLGVLLWVAGLALVAIAVWLALRRVGRSQAATLLPAFVGGSVAVPYLLLVGYAAPRFLLPAYALLALPAGEAVRSILKSQGGRLRWLAAVAMTAAFAAHVTVQFAWLDDNMRGQERSRERWAAVSAALDRQGVRPPCTLIGRESPPVAYVAGCDAVHVARLPGDEPYTLEDLRETTRRERVALVLRPGETVPAHARGWAPVPAAQMPRGFRAFVAPRP